MGGNEGLKQSRSTRDNNGPAAATREFVEKPLGESDSEQLKVVTLPPMSTLDIVGIARMSGLPGTALVCDFSHQPSSSLIKMQTEREYLSSLKKDSREHQQINQEHKPKRRKSL